MNQHILYCTEVVKVVRLDYTFERQLMLEGIDRWKEGFKESWQEEVEQLVKSCEL